MRHGIEDDRRRRTLGTNLRCQLHNPVRLTAHQASRCGIVECKSRDGDFVQPPELHSRLASGIYYEIPGRGVEDIQECPQRKNGQKPVSCMAQALPHLLEVKLRDHNHQHGDSKCEERILILLVHPFYCCRSLIAFSCFFGIENLTFSLSSLFS